MTDDLQTLAAEAIRELRGRYGPLGDGSLRSGCAGELADAVLAAVLPAHRRQVLAEAGLSTTPRPLWEDADLARLDTAEIIAWFIHWACHRGGACQCETPEDEEIDHGQRAASALRRIGRLVIATPTGVPLAEVLAALRDRSGLADWLEGKGRFVWPDGPTLDIAGTYLADRFGAKEGTDG